MSLIVNPSESINVSIAVNVISVSIAVNFSPSHSSNVLLAPEIFNLNFPLGPNNLCT